MYQRLPRYAPVLLFMAILMTAACQPASDAPTAPATSGGPQNALTAEPEVVKPEFLPAAGCFTRPAFVVRLAVRMHGRFFPRGLRFHFVDRFGTRSLPEVMPIPSPSGTVSSFPSSSPVPIPGVAALPSPFPSSGSAPFLVRFACGIFPEGTLFINADHDGGTVAMKVLVSDR